MGKRDTELQGYRATELKSNKKGAVTRESEHTTRSVPFLLQSSKKGDLELDEIIKIMLGVVLLIILIAIIWYIKGEFTGQGTSIKDSFNIFK